MRTTVLVLSVVLLMTNSVMAQPGGSVDNLTTYVDDTPGNGYTGGETLRVDQESSVWNSFPGSTETYDFFVYIFWEDSNGTSPILPARVWQRDVAPGDFEEIDSDHTLNASATKSFYVFYAEVYHVDQGELATHSSTTYVNGDAVVFWNGNMP